MRNSPEVMIRFAHHPGFRAAGHMGSADGDRITGDRIVVTCFQSRALLKPQPITRELVRRSNCSERLFSRQQDGGD